MINAPDVALEKRYSVLPEVREKLEEIVVEQIDVRKGLGRNSPSDVKVELVLCNIYYYGHTIIKDEIPTILVNILAGLERNKELESNYRVILEGTNQWIKETVTTIMEEKNLPYMELDLITEKLMERLACQNIAEMNLNLDKLVGELGKGPIDVFVPLVKRQLEMLNPDYGQEFSNYQTLQKKLWALIVEYKKITSGKNYNLIRKNVRPVALETKGNFHKMLKVMATIMGREWFWGDFDINKYDKRSIKGIWTDVKLELNEKYIPYVFLPRIKGPLSIFEAAYFNRNPGNLGKLTLSDDNPCNITVNSFLRNFRKSYCEQENTAKNLMFNRASSQRPEYTK